MTKKMKIMGVCDFWHIHPYIIFNEKSSLYIFMICKYIGLVWFVGFYGISTFVGCLTPNPFLCK